MWRPEPQYLPFAGSDQVASTRTDCVAAQHVYSALGKEGDLTDELRRSKNVLKLVSRLNLMRNPKINQFNPGVGHVLVKQHDVLRLEGEKHSGHNDILRLARFLNIKYYHLR